MGLFRDLKRLSEQGRRLRDEYPAARQSADASAKLGEATALMEQLSASQAAAPRVLAHGVDAVAVITGVRQQTTILNHSPLVELDLLVTMPSGVPVPVTRSEVVSLIHLSRAQVGTRLSVRVDPTDPSAIWINWAGSAAR